jgi:CheY-like chemotaxis protein
MKKYKFLVFIDDDSFTNTFHQIILDEADICEEYMFFNSGEKALEFFVLEAQKENSKVPEYIFLDINMPSMNGWQFLDKYTQIEGEQAATIIMLTTSISRSDKSKTKDYKIIEAFMNKPLTVEHLKGLL